MGFNGIIYIYIFGVYIYNYIRNIKVIHGKNEGSTINQWEFHGIYIRDIYIIYIYPPVMENHHVFGKSSK